MTAELHVLSAGYSDERVAGTVVPIRDRGCRDAIPGIASHRSRILQPLAALAVDADEPDVAVLVWDLEGREMARMNGVDDGDLFVRGVGPANLNKRTRHAAAPTRTNHVYLGTCAPLLQVALLE